MHFIHSHVLPNIRHVHPYGHDARYALGGFVLNLLNMTCLWTLQHCFTAQNCSLCPLILLLTHERFTQIYFRVWILIARKTAGISMLTNLRAACYELRRGPDKLKLARISVWNQHVAPCLCLILHVPEESVRTARHEYVVACSHAHPRLQLFAFRQSHIMRSSALLC